jgi:hypothetical protein
MKKPFISLQWSTEVMFTCFCWAKIDYNFIIFIIYNFIIFIFISRPWDRSSKRRDDLPGESQVAWHVRSRSAPCDSKKTSTLSIFFAKLSRSYRAKQIYQFFIFKSKPLWMYACVRGKEALDCVEAGWPDNFRKKNKI